VPCDPALTVYDEEHAITYMRMLDADAEGADWREVAGSSCTSIRTASLIERGGPSIVTSRAPNGFQGMDTVTCFDVAGLALMPDKGKAQLTMFEMAINRRWGRWDWIVSERTGRVIVFGREMSYSAARYQAARALFQLLLAVGRTYNSPQTP
jgi:hypothetical protein